MSHHDAPSDKSFQPLIDQLASDLKPVKVKSLRALAFQYFLSLYAVGLIFFSALGRSSGAWIGVTQGEFVFSLIIFTLGIGSGSYLLAQYSRPGINESRLVTRIFFFLLFVAAVVEMMRWVMRIGFSTWGPPIQGGWVCLFFALAIGGIGASLLALGLRREAPVKLKEAGFFALLTGAAMGALVLQLHCPNENPVHQILWHMVFPMSFFLLGAKAFSRRALRW